MNETVWDVRVFQNPDNQSFDDDVQRSFGSGKKRVCRAGIDKHLLTKIGLDLDEAVADRVIALKEELKEKIGLDLPYDVPNEYLDEEGMVDWLCRSALKN